MLTCSFPLAVGLRLGGGLVGAEALGHSEAKGTSGGGGLTVTGWDVRRGGEGLG